MEEWNGGRDAGIGNGQIMKKGNSSTLTGEKGEIWGRKDGWDVEEFLHGSFCEIESKVIFLERERLWWCSGNEEERRFERAV